MTNTQRRANAIRRESGDNRARLRGIVLRILSNKAKPEPRQPYLENQVENHHPSNGQRRVVSRKESEHSYARYRSVARMQRSITETINEKLRERTLPYAATIVHSGVDAPNIKRGHELPCQTQPYPATPAEPTAHRIPNAVQIVSSTQLRVHSIKGGKRRRCRSSQRSIVQLKHQAAKEQIPPYSATRLKHAMACECNLKIERPQTPPNRTTYSRKTRESRYSRIKQLDSSTQRHVPVISRGRADIACARRSRIV